jgi:iron complex outermembrane receptor protein
MELRGVQNIGQALDTVPGVSRNFGFTGNQRFRVRGFTNVGNLRDGFRQNVVQPEVDLAGVETVEVLKGPASALYGRFEPGGVINFVSRVPQSDFGSHLAFTGGAFDYYRMTADATGPIGDGGKVTYRAIGAYTDTGSFRDYLDSRQFFASGALRFELGPRSRLDVRGEYLHYEGDFDRGLGNNAAFLSVPIERNYGGPDLFIEKNQFVGSARLSHHLAGGWEFRAGAFVSDIDVPEERFFNYGTPIVAGDIVNRRFVRYGFEEQKDRTVQIETTGTFRTGGVTHRVLAGYEYNYDIWRFGDSARGPNLPTPLDRSATDNPFPEPSGPYSNGYYEFTTNAVYAQDEMAFGDRVRVLLGGRQEWTSGAAEDSFFGPFPGISRDHRPFAPRAGLTFKATPAISLYTSWAESERVEVDAGVLPGGGLPLPTRGEQIEVGTKALLLGGRLESTFAWYDLRKKDALVSNPADPNTLIQVGEITSKGIELELSARPMPSLTVVGGYTYSDAYISEDPGPNRGRMLTGIPEHQFSAFGTYLFTVLRGFSLGGGIVAAGRQASNTANTFFLPGYTRIDLIATQDFGPVRLRLNVDNLGNETYYFTGGFAQVYPQPPRKVLASLEFDIGSRRR